MREIKFRAWGNKEMVYSKVMPDFSFWKWAGYSSNTVLMQFTGLKDKNGKEIYEGDIVEYKIPTKEGFLYKGVIRFDSGSYFIDPPIATVFNLLFQNIDAVKVIGNCYEHPHLLINITIPLFECCECNGTGEIERNIDGADVPTVCCYCSGTGKVDS